MSAEPSSASYADSVNDIRELHRSVLALEAATGLLRRPALAGREWFELLSRKLLPQMGVTPYLVVAVVGGTNIGKSVVFNHLAGFRGSSSSPLASGTKHPVLLIPQGFAETHDVASIFPGFELREWTAAEGALQADAADLLFYRESAQLPRNLLLLDTPDIDSDAVVNWRRADFVRQSADVLVAVLTQQKYNDAAVKQFFRHAAAEDKACVVVFNQCLLPDDEVYWPQWLATFSRETGVVPDRVYVTPHDRRAAEDLRLPFYFREWSAEGDVAAQPGVDARSAVDATSPMESAETGVYSLQRDLAELHFDATKLRTLRGSLRHLLVDEQGLPGYLDEIRRESARFADALKLLAIHELAHIDGWPSVPNRLLVDEIRQWWRTQRQGLTRSVHDAYSTLTGTLVVPVNWMRERMWGPTADPAAEYVSAERNVLLISVDRAYVQLERLTAAGNATLQPYLEHLLAGTTRVALIRELTAELDRFALSDLLRDVVAEQMVKFRDGNPGIFKMLSRLDSALAFARPMTSVALFVAGAGPVGDAMVPVLADAAMVHVVGNVAAGAGTVIAGEAAVAGAGQGARQFEAWFHNLHATITARRVAWFSEFLNRQLLGRLHADLTAAAAVPQSPAFKQVEATSGRLQNRLQLYH